MMYDVDRIVDDIAVALVEAGPAVLAVLIGVGALALLFSLVSYVFRSLALSAAGKNRGVKTAWLAWIPFVRVGYLWVMGAIADRQEARIGKKRGWAVWFLVLWLAANVPSWIGMSAVWNAVSTAIEASIRGNYYTDDVFFSNVLGGVLGSSGLITLSVAAAALLNSFGLIALYKYYDATRTNQAIVFLLLSLLFPVITPFLMFACRKYDGGVKLDDVPAAPQIAPEVPAEPKETESV